MVPKSKSLGFAFAIAEPLLSYTTREGRWLVYLLHRPDKSIKDIAFELDFPNLSFFGKYVKKHLGMSPKMYRQKKDKLGIDD